MTAIWRRVRKPDPPHEAEQVGEVPPNVEHAPPRGTHAGPGEDTTKPATRAQTGRALGNWSEADDVIPDHTIWTLTELAALPIWG